MAQAGMSSSKARGGVRQRGWAHLSDSEWFYKCDRHRGAETLQNSHFSRQDPVWGRPTAILVGTETGHHPTAAACYTLVYRMGIPAHPQAWQSGNCASSNLHSTLPSLPSRSKENSFTGCQRGNADAIPWEAFG